MCEEKRKREREKKRKRKKGKELVHAGGQWRRRYYTNTKS